MHLDLFMNLFVVNAAGTEIPQAVQPSCHKPPGQHFDCNLFVLKHLFLLQQLC